MKTNKTVLCRLLPLFALMLVMGAFLFAGAATAYAASDPAGDGSPPAETLSVDEVWLTGDTLHITVTNKDGGDSQTLELNLSDYAKSGDEYVTIQATDSGGNTSNIIQFKNPYYAPQTDTGSGDNVSPTPDGGVSDPAAPDGSNPGNGVTPASGSPFTPDGAGTVMDNAVNGDGKEFFTVQTADGNVFYLIVDRQRTADNVYLLNAVTEDDLASLAKPGDGKSAGTVVTPTTAAPVVTPETTPEQTPPPAPAKSGGGSTGTIVFVIIAVAAVGGAGYYFKIVRPKQLGTNGSDEYDESEDGEKFDDNEEMDVNDEGDDDE